MIRISKMKESAEGSLQVGMIHQISGWIWQKWSNQKNKKIPPKRKKRIKSSSGESQLDDGSYFPFPRALPPSLTFTRAHTRAFFLGFRFSPSACQLEPTRAARITSRLTGERSSEAWIVCILDHAHKSKSRPQIYFRLTVVPSRTLKRWKLRVSPVWERIILLYLYSLFNEGIHMLSFYFNNFNILHSLNFTFPFKTLTKELH